MTEREKLLSEIESFLKKSGMTSTQFGIEAKNERSLMNRLRAGGGVGLDTAKLLRDYMRDYKPKARPKKRASFQPAA